ncbi:MAG TPA: histidine kinase [Cyanobacteria bacterium UBA8803]|nr:histidine kinase [Cyanobacteria bacterium UBA9273]HBL59399.1 histidine kinase [Cyanobacteria bacterium UBA8803]
MKWSFVGKWIAGGFGLTLLLMGAISLASYKNITQLIESVDRVQHTYEALNTLADFYSTMTVAESGRRGYIFSGSEQELKRHQIALDDMQSEMRTLQQQMSGSLIQQQRWKSLNSLVAQRLILFRQSIALYQKDKSAVQTQALITDRSVKLRGEIQTVLAEIKAEEEQLLRIWIDQSRSSIHYRVLIEVISTFLSFAIIAGVYFTIYNQGVQRQKFETLQRNLAQEKELASLKVRLFSMISHEFRTPLSVILASSQLLEEILQDTVEKTQLRNLYRIQSSAKLMNQLLTDILTLTRAEAGKLEYKLEPLDVEGFCLNLVEDMQFCSLTQHTIRFISEGHCTRANMDEKMLYSILGNLLLNAIKYSPEGGNIYLVLRCEPEATVFQIKDEGIGIPDQDIQKIYEPFYRGQNVDNIVGTGLGLAVVKKCLDLHQGEISVESKVGAGTTFTIRIPR